MDKMMGQYPRETPSPQKGREQTGGVLIRRGWNELGLSIEGRLIRAYSNFDWDALTPWTLIVGGTHGDERATVPFLETFIADHLEKGEGLGPVLVIPVLNPDGYFRDSRYNARGVDLNRNFPELWNINSDEPPGEGPLSEPESRLLHDLLMTAKPLRILSLHWALSEIDPEGEHGHAWAKGMWENMEHSHRRLFRLREPGERSLLPGSLGTFCRLRLKDAVHLITLELPYHPEPDLDPLPGDHFATALALWKEDRDRYWNGVYPAVENLLRFAAGAG